MNLASMSAPEHFAFWLGLVFSLGAWWGVFVPRMRPTWKGTCIPCGRVACLGAAIASGGVPLALFVGGEVNSTPRILTGLVIAFGLLLVVVGYCLDTIKPKA